MTHFGGESDLIFKCACDHFEGKFSPPNKKHAMKLFGLVFFISHDPCCVPVLFLSRAGKLSGS